MDKQTKKKISKKSFRDRNLQSSHNNNRIGGEFKSDMVQGVVGGGDTWCVSETSGSVVNWNERNNENSSVSEGQKDALETVITAFKNMPFYDCYYRFIVPIEYNHPDFEGCDKEIWNVLYQLLFGSFQVECHLHEQFDGSLELYFCDADGREGVVSDLSVYELDVLILYLWTALGIYLLPTLGPEIMNMDVEPTCKECELITRDEFFSLYKKEAILMDNNLLALLEKMYDRIVKCHTESFPYRR